MAINEAKYIWMDGELVEWKNATVHVLTHTLHYGSGVFEGLRCYNTPDGPAIFRLREHMERFDRSARMIMMPTPYSVDEMCNAVIETVKANNLPDCYIRPLMYRGYGAMGLDPRPAPVKLMVAAWEWPSFLGKEAQENGLPVGISSWRQRGANSHPGAIKATGNYLNSSLARMESDAHGYQEAILLTEDGHVCEGTGENLFIVRDGILSTPPLSDGPLEGITRSTIMQLAVDMEIPVLEESLIRTDLYAADEMFMTGSAAELVPVSSVDGREIGKPGEITKKLQKAYFDVVRGELAGYDDWLEYV